MRFRILILTATICLVAAVLFVVFLAGEKPDPQFEIASRIVGQVQRGETVQKSDIDSRLGPPYDRTFKEWDHAYQLGDDGTYFAIDSSWLVIRLDPASSRVIDARILVD